MEPNNNGSQVASLYFGGHHVKDTGFIPFSIGEKVKDKIDT